MKRSRHDLVVIGTSAGGVEALCSLAQGLPKDFAGAILVVMHIGGTSVLPDILGRCGPMKVSMARDGDLIERGHIFVAPPDHHLLVRDAHLELSRGARENRARPAIDPLFRSAAREFRSRVVGVVLTGALDDGTAGLFAVKSRGGLAIVQEPSDAANPSMPLNALRHIDVDYCLPLDKMAKHLVKLVGRGKRGELKPPRPAKPKDLPNGDQVPFSCPECDGPMFAVKSGRLLHFHCRVGHRYSPQSLSEAHGDALERALWIAVRHLRERSAIQRALAKGSASTEKKIAAKFEAAAETADRDALMLQEILEHL